MKYEFLIKSIYDGYKLDAGKGWKISQVVKLWNESDQEVMVLIVLEKDD